jgi:hypothetical protein
MELKTAIDILEYHQEWRLGKREDMIHEPKKLTQALDIVLSEVKKLPIHNVRDSCEWCGTKKENRNGLCKECGRFPSPNNYR